jgi:hypothetical protein
MQARLFSAGHSFTVRKKKYSHRIKINKYFVKNRYKNSLRQFRYAIVINRINASLVVLSGAQFYGNCKSYLKRQHFFC